MSGEVGSKVTHARRVLLLPVVALAALAAAACGGAPGGADPGAGQPPAPRVSISLGSTEALGKFLVDGDGRTLYYFGLDLPARGELAAISNCTGSCLGIWPLFHVDTPTLGAGLSAADFGEIVRADGAKQTTFKGWPLYRFAADTRPGDTNGDNFEGWYVLRDPFYSVLNLTKDEFGARLFLADPAGRTLYVFARDTVGTSTTPPVSSCVGQCITNFPAFSTESGVVPTGVDASKLSTFTRADGTKQSAFDGHPLYFFSGDTAPGDTKGQGVNGVWDTVDPKAL